MVLINLTIQINSIANAHILKQLWPAKLCARVRMSNYSHSFFRNKLLRTNIRNEHASQFWLFTFAIETFQCDVMWDNSRNYHSMIFSKGYCLISIDVGNNILNVNTFLSRAYQVRNLFVCQKLELKPITTANILQRQFYLFWTLTKFTSLLNKPICFSVKCGRIVRYKYNTQSTCKNCAQFFSK